MEYKLLDTGEGLRKAMEKWAGMERIAVDFECEFNLHIYGEHLCLIQVYDGKEHYIIDPRANAVSKEDVIAFLTSDVKKVWFDCQSDNSLVGKRYNVAVKNIEDVRVYALALGHVGNLLSLEQMYLGLPGDDFPNKKKLQQTNWTRRPLSDEQLRYALSDVTNLLALDDRLKEEVGKAGLKEECERQMRDKTKQSVPKPAWTKLGPWQKMSRAQKDAMKQYFLARDAVARRFNVPAANVLDKHSLISMAMNPPRSEGDVMEHVKKASPRFREQFAESAMKAFKTLNSQG